MNYFFRSKELWHGTSKPPGARTEEAKSGESLASETKPADTGGGNLPPYENAT
jgi:hypothetical protein